jgi:hypothetical protein
MNLIFIWTGESEQMFYKKRRIFESIGFKWIISGLELTQNETKESLNIKRY